MQELNIGTVYFRYFRLKRVFTHRYHVDTHFLQIPAPFEALASDVFTVHRSRIQSSIDVQEFKSHILTQSKYGTVLLDLILANLSKYPTLCF